MRGWIHLWSFFITLISGGTLITLAATTATAAAWISVTVYVLTILGLFGVSALYHRHHWASNASRAWMKRLDHSMIFIFIAGTYTPFAVLTLSDQTGAVVLGVIWGGAAAGVALKLLWPHAPRWVGVPIYIGLGWVAVFVMPEIGQNAGIAALVLLIVGGVFYTVGAVFYATRWPDPWPTVFGYHEFFHATTVVAALCHHIAIWFVLFG
ncbi:PAQR family membrane homeostasis protein TrhA [Actinoalloteichus hymeniacidonis]|uniref:Channel protein, hemolysin III family n=1 Tax=Actinoalloteichus hymeniacidonis TaxID=340345 RepID=A0AAC9MX92_9PSEU|nr:hemolysin III family protein [Actinoalloteichus hymeniacidonis]AOS61652.1 channel protein, hemolysin III family [Actinoalloteichus hymeniacidonis]